MKPETQETNPERLQEVASLRAALEEIRNMAMARKSCIRMPDGRMLDTFCRHALSPNLAQLERDREEVVDDDREAQRSNDKIRRGEKDTNA